MIPFTKAHACGNDFLVIAEDAVAGRDWAELARRMCARNTGIGADGIEFFAWTGPQSGRIRLHNADGSIAEISGNGTRCVAAWMAEQRGAAEGAALAIESAEGMRVCRVNRVKRDGEFTVEITTGMGVPQFARRTVTIPAGVQVEGVEVSTGNPHFVVIVDNAEFTVDGQRWQSVGQQICGHPDFPYQTNVEFVRVTDTNRIEFRIFERGVGPTLSSGTGSSASAAASIELRGAARTLTVVAEGGAQTVEWLKRDSSLMLTGPAEIIAQGECLLV